MDQQIVTLAPPTGVPLRFATILESGDFTTPKLVPLLNFHAFRYLGSTLPPSRECELRLRFSPDGKLGTPWRLDPSQVQVVYDGIYDGNVKKFLFKLAHSNIFQLGSQFEVLFLCRMMPPLGMYVGNWIYSKMPSARLLCPCVLFRRNNTPQTVRLRQTETVCVYAQSCLKTFLPSSW